MSLHSTFTSAINRGPMSVFGHMDYEFSALGKVGSRIPSNIKVGTVVQFNVGLYSALVSTKTEGSYVCLLGTQNATPGFGYSDLTVLREGDEVIFCTLPGDNISGMILARKPTIYSVDANHPNDINSKTKMERRTSFFSKDCYRPENAVYQVPLTNPNDISTRRYPNKPTDLVPGEFGTINQHKCGIIGGMYSTTLYGGGSHIRLFSLENKIRIVADSIIQHTLLGNKAEWHNRRYLSEEQAYCLYQEERLGLHTKEQPAFDQADYDKDGYFTKNKVKKQTLKPRIINQQGYYGGISSRYVLQPDPDLKGEPRSLNDSPKDPGVLRESIDPSGQYRLAAVGMIGTERIGRIPVPIRKVQPWAKEAEEPEAKKLTEFKHSEDNPFYRQLELADRVAYDLKNSYARTDEATSEFYTPEESDLENKPKDVYDQGFTDSTTVKIEKYDKRRSGIWQGEDGSIILRDAWGSEIVMLGGNIQFSCPGSIEVMPGKSALVLAGDDAIVKAQNSIDIESADKDVRVNAFHNVQVLAGVDDDNPGGITLESKGKSYPWDIQTPPGGESVRTNGILLKSDTGRIVTDTENMVLKADKVLSIVAGKEQIQGGDGIIMMSAHGVYSYGDQVISTTKDSSLILTEKSAVVTAESALLAGGESATVLKGTDVMIPLMWASIDDNIHNEIEEALDKLEEALTEEQKVSQGYEEDKLEKMYFRFRNSQECDTERAWELNSTSSFRLYQPFWSQIMTKFETLRGSVSEKEFDDHIDAWGGDAGNPWPGTEAINSGRYITLASGTPENLDSDGMNKSRKQVKDSTSISEQTLFPGYKIRK